MLRNIIAGLTLALACCAAASAQSLTTITGTIRDNTGALVTSGQVEFALQPGGDTMTSGIARFTASIVDCLINGSGLVKALDGTSACTLVQNTSITTPSNTSYRACIQPGFIQPGSCFVFYAIGSTLDITTTPATPPLTPAYSLVDTFSTQTITGAKTFSGTTTFSGTLTLGALSLGGNLSLGSNGITSVTGITNSGDYINCASCTVKWGSSGTSSVDAGISRIGAGLIGIGNGGQGDFSGTLKATTLNATNYQVGGIGQSGTGPLCATTLCTLTTPAITGPTIDTINQKAATAFTIQDNTSGVRIQVPSNGTGQTVINNANLTASSTIGGTGSTNANIQYNRLKSGRGSTVVSGDFAISSAATGFGSWGSTASIASVSGTDAAGTININCAGTGQTGNPAVKITFHDGAWPSSPIPFAMRGDGNSPSAAIAWFTSSTTSATFAMTGTCIAGSTYTISWLMF